jgi:acetyl esterase/lipase
MLGLFVSAFAPAIARADDAVDYSGTAITDPTEALLTQGIDPNTVVPTTVDTCWSEAGPGATITSVTYKTFSSGGTQHNLVLDIYIPPIGPGPYTTVVMVHGGGWTGGCRKWNDAMASYMALHGFLVFNIDYRVACTDPNVYLCGYPYPTPIDDVKSAVSWVRGHDQTYASVLGPVVAVGTSAGGNLVYMAGTTGIPGDSQPDLMAGGSGHPEMGYMSDLAKACEESDQSATCRANALAYMNFNLDNSRDWCGDGGGDNWSPASPACNVTSTTPGAFIANATKELSAYVAAEDLAGRLAYNQVSYTFCTVGNDDTSNRASHYHGTQLFDFNLNPAPTCAENGQPPLDYLIQWINGNLP